MRKFLLPVILMLVTIGCREDEVESESEVYERMRRRIEANAAVIDLTFTKIANKVAAEGGIAELLRTSPSRLAFIDKMHALTKDLYPTSVDESRQTLELGSSTFQNSSRTYTSFRKLVAGVSAGNTIESQTLFSKVSLYAQQVHDTVAKNPSRQIQIESFSWGPASTNRTTRPDFRISGEKLLDYQKRIGALILQHNNTAQLDQAIASLLQEEKESKVFIVLLLPAIQKVRKQEPGFGRFFNDLFGALPAAEQDLIMKQMRFLAFNAAIDHFVSTSFNGKDENTASMETNQQMTYGVSVLAWARI